MIYYNSKSLDRLLAIVNSGEIYKGKVMASNICSNECVYLEYCHDEKTTETVIDDDDLVEQITDCRYDHNIAGFFGLNSIYSHAFRLKIGPSYFSRVFQGHPLILASEN